MYNPVPVPSRTPVLLTGATVLPIADRAGRPVEALATGDVLLVDGRIAAYGPVGTLSAPEGTQTIDAAGKYVTPGLFEAHGHIGIDEDGVPDAGDDTNESMTPDGSGLRALDGINPDDIGFKDALRGGVTAALIKPGSANPIGGRSAAVKVWGRIVDEMLISQDLSVKSALGENPKRFFGNQGKEPSKRTGVARELRRAFTAAQDYRAAKEYAEAEGKPFTRDLGKETLVQVLDGELAWDQHCHRADDIATAIRLSKEFGYRVVINHATEGHRIADFLAAEGVDCIVGPLMTSRSKVELRNRTLSTPAALAAAGVRIALTTDHPVIPINFLIHEASLAVKEGLPRDTALQALTINPALMFGLEGRLGSLAPDTDADVVVWSGDPLDVLSRVERVFIDGRQVYTHNDATGAADVADPYGPTLVNVP
jgi:imidazolonepropionase-like amidohydrolase